MNMDWSLKAAVDRLNGLPNILVMYDVMCQYSVHLQKRFDVEHMPSIRHLQIRPGIGLFHVHGHQESCFSRFSPNFIKGAGQVDGEVIETLWAPLNRVSGSTRGMTAAHRKEVIDDHMNDSNWLKTTRIGMIY